MNLHKKRPSGSTAIAFTALLVALGGTSYAAATGSIDSREIKNNSVKSGDVKNNSLASKDVKNNTLTGSDVNESKLGTVPAAAVAGSAGSAATAGNANTVGGYAPGGLIRTALESVDEEALTGVSGSNVAASTQLVAPTKGYLTITASSDVYNSNGDPSGIDCWIEVNATYLAASERTIDLDTGNNEEDCSTNITLPVGTGTHVIELWGDLDSTTDVFDETTLSVLFTPFGANGAPLAKSAATGAKKTKSGN